MEIENFFDDEGYSQERLRYDGHVFDVNYNRDIEERLTQKFPNFQCLEKDVLLACFPKTGTHWFNNIVGMLKQGDTSYKGSPYSIDYHDLEKLNQMQQPRVYNSHLRYELIPEPIKKSKDVKIINLVRNPKDTAVSYYMFAKSLGKYEYKRSLNGFLSIFLRDDFYFDGWFNYVKSWDEALRSNDKDKILRVTYEETLKDLEGTIKKLNTFLGTQRDDEFLAKVKDHVSFANLKGEHRGESQNVGGDFTEFMKEGVFPVYRKGTVGDWKNNLTVAQNENFDQVFKEKMKGYEHIPVYFEI